MESPLFRPNQLTAIINNHTDNYTIDEAIARNYGILQEHFFDWLLNQDDHLKVLEEIRAVTSGSVPQTQLQQCWDNEANELDDELIFLLKEIKYIYLHIELARTSEEQSQAWAFNNSASLMTDKALEKSEAILSRIYIENRSNQNSKNAQGRNKFILLVKEEAARLLEEMCPKGGWPSKVNAVAALEGPLAAFIDPDKSSGGIPSTADIKSKTLGGVTTTNIQNRLTTWLREDEIVRIAWEKNKRPQRNPNT